MFHAIILIFLVTTLFVTNIQTSSSVSVYDPVPGLEPSPYYKFRIRDGPDEENFSAGLHFTTISVTDLTKPEVVFLYFRKVLTFSKSSFFLHFNSELSLVANPEKSYLIFSPFLGLPDALLLLLNLPVVFELP